MALICFDVWPDENCCCCSWQPRSVYNVVLDGVGLNKWKLLTGNSDYSRQNKDLGKTSRCWRFSSQPPAVGEGWSAGGFPPCFFLANIRQDFSMVMETDGCKYMILDTVAIDVSWFLTSSTGWSALSASGNSECLLCHLPCAQLSIWFYCIS